VVSRNLASTTLARRRTILGGSEIARPSVVDVVDAVGLSLHTWPMSGRRYRQQPHVPGPDELAPGWGWSANTPEARIQQASSIASNIGRSKGRKARAGKVTVTIMLVLFVLILVPVVVEIVRR
jgi:hypothetical protein